MSKKQLSLTDLPAGVFDVLCDTLDINSSWRRLVTCLSHTPFKLNDIERENCSRVLWNSVNDSPSSKLLNKLAYRGMTVESLCHYLQQENLERALECIKEHEPLEIKVHPPERLEVLEGQELVIKCHATGFPSPSYVWLKGKQEIRSCRDGLFVLHPALEEHKGEYSCRVQHQRRGEGGVRFEMSKKCVVTIKKCNNFKAFKPVNQASAQNIHKPDQTGLPKILIQPTSQTNSLGGVVLFRVEAQHANLALSYKWLFKGHPIQDGNSNEYRIGNASKKNAGEYQVRVYSKEYSNIEVLSNVVTLSIINKPNTFYARDKVALILGNSTYRSYGAMLPAVKQDMIQTSKCLQDMDFKVISLLDLTLGEMQAYLEMFCTMVTEQVYVLFYCIGHGFLLNHKHYLVPWDASQGLELQDSLCIEDCIQHIQERSPIMMMVLVDICRKNVELSTHPTNIQPCNQPLPKSKPNQVIIYAACLNEQSFETQDKKSPRGLFNQYLLQVFKDNNITIKDFYGELQKRFQDGPFDLHNENAQHPEMTINLQDPGRSLWDPICQKSPPSLSNVGLQFWESIETLPRPVAIPVDSHGVIHLTFMKLFSNVLALQTNFESSHPHHDHTIDLNVNLILPVEKHCVNAVEFFHLHNLQRLKQKMILDFVVHFERHKAEEGNKNEDGGKEGNFVGETGKYQFGYPLISAQNLKF